MRSMHVQGEQLWKSPELWVGTPKALLNVTSLCCSSASHAHVSVLHQVQCLSQAIVRLGCQCTGHSSLVQDPLL